MKRDISNNKLAVYTIFLYLLLLVMEIFMNLFYSTFNHSKVSVTFMSKMKEIFELIRVEVIIYFLLLILIYVGIAWINFRFVLAAAKAVQTRKPFKALPIKGFLFIVINGYFILTLYFLNFAFYPGSRVSDFAGLFLNPVHSRAYFITSFTMMAVYFLFLILAFLFQARKWEKVAVIAVVGFLLVSNFHPTYFINNILTSLKGGNENIGPNVIFIGIDSLNPLHTGYFGYPKNTTPHLDQFLKENIVFNNSYTPLARTSGSWYSILTGQYPKSNGMRYNLMNRDFINPSSRTITNYLKNRKGYFTCHFTDENRFCNLMKEDGFQEMTHPVMGLQDFVFGTIHDFSMTNLFFNCPLGHMIFRFMKHNRAAYAIYKPRYFSNTISRSIPSLKSKERFVFITHFCAPHWPYHAPYPYPFIFTDGQGTPYERYDGAIRLADDQFGRVINSLRKNDLYDNSLIIVLSDHGETMKGHGTNLTETDQNHILLAMKLPGKNRHSEISALARTIDITPTILDILGESPEEFSFDGTSLVSMIEHPLEKSDPEKSIIMETGFSVDVPGGVSLAYQELLNKGITFYEFDEKGIITVKKDLHQDLIKRKQRAIKTDKWKLVLQPDPKWGQEKNVLTLFSLDEDPRCLNDVASIYPDITGMLLKRLREFYGKELDLAGGLAEYLKSKLPQ